MRNEQPDETGTKNDPSLARSLGALAAVLGIVLAFAWGVAALFKWAL